MKRFTTLLSALVISISMFADRGPTRLTITNFDNPDIVVFVDGRKFTDIRNSLVLNDISFGNHFVKVYRVKRGWFNHDQLIFSSKVFLRPNYQVNVMINRSGDVRLAEQGFGRGRGDDRYGRNDDRRDYGNNEGRNRNDRDDDRRDYGNNDGHHRNDRDDDRRGPKSY